MTKEKSRHGSTSSRKGHDGGTGGDGSRYGRAEKRGGRTVHPKIETSENREIIYVPDEGAAIIADTFPDGSWVAHWERAGPGEVPSLVPETVAREFFPQIKGEYAPEPVIMQTGDGSGKETGEVSETAGWDEWRDGPGKGLFKYIDPESDEARSFREWARKNYVVGTDINPLWHPLVRAEIELMNAEALKKGDGPFGRKPKTPEEKALKVLGEFETDELKGQREYADAAKSDLPFIQSERETLEKQAADESRHADAIYGMMKRIWERRGGDGPITEEDIREALKRPEAFMAPRTDRPLFDTWSLGPGILTRDSNSLDQSNAQALKDALEEAEKNGEIEPDSYEVMTSRHWGPGWVENLAFKAVDEKGKPTRMFRFLMKWQDKLSDYPVADEEDLSRRERQAELELIEEVGGDNLREEVPGNWAETVWEDLWHSGDVTEEYVDPKKLKDSLKKHGFLETEDGIGTFYPSEARAINTGRAIVTAMDDLRKEKQKADLRGDSKRSEEFEFQINELKSLLAGTGLDVKTVRPLMRAPIRERTVPARDGPGRELSPEALERVRKLGEKYGPVYGPVFVEKARAEWENLAKKVVTVESPGGFGARRSEAAIRMPPDVNIGFIADKTGLGLEEIQRKSETHRWTMRNGRLVTVPKGENLYVERLGSLDDVKKALAGVETDYKAGLLLGEGVKSRTGILRQGLAQKFASWLLRLEQAESGERPVRLGAGSNPEHTPILRTDQMMEAVSLLSDYRAEHDAKPVKWSEFMDHVYNNMTRRGKPSRKQLEAWTESVLSGRLGAIRPKARREHAEAARTGKLKESVPGGQV